MADAATRSQLPDDLAAKMKAFHLQRQGASSTLRTPTLPDRSVSGSSAIGCRGSSPALSSSNSPQVPGGRPLPPTFNSAPSVPHIKKGLAAKRGLGMKLSDAAPPAAPAPSEPVPNAESSSLFDKFSEYVDTDTGTLNFRGKATIHGSGIEFSGGKKFDISLNEVDTLDELGKGNYGTVFKVRHARPRIRRPGQGLAGNRVQQPESQDPQTGKVMAMKEIRLELDEAKFAAIIMELDILHRCRSPYIIDFYGAFFQEGAVYICMQFMDGGSIDKLYGDGVPEGVLRKITLATVMGLKCLKDDHNIIHRDVKPTNILVNSAGCVKICDFGVSGNLVASIAKTNIGCQSYMAPERISGGGMAQASAVAGGGTYSVQSDIWSLGLTVIECALGQYPYPPETYDNIFSQLSVSGWRDCIRLLITGDCGWRAAGSTPRSLFRHGAGFYQRHFAQSAKVASHIRHVAGSSVVGQHSRLRSSQR